MHRAEIVVVAVGSGLVETRHQSVRGQVTGVPFTKEKVAAEQRPKVLTQKQL